MYTLLSIDSLTEQDLKEFAKCKYLGPIISRSFIVPKIVAVYPTQTYTCHASMVTGCYPDRHSIINNTVAFGSDWHWMRSDINVPILTDYLKNEGFVTASCAFPCLGGADIDYLIPEVWTESADMDSDLAFVSEPCPTSEKALPYYYKNKGLLDWMRTPGFDLFATSCFIDIVR
ncbi:MAG: alkaline phosphatase family protein, partial [Sphaerochaetaceae bacterium]|nr:alkaline phosphatase family protein [Sphaerochaetaceae bacterium]